jgi:hypothetical protein
MAGSLWIGVNALTGYNLRINKAITGSAYPFSLAVSGAVQSDVTGIGTYIHAISSTQATAFTLPQITLFNAEQGTFGAGSTVTYQVGFNVTNLSGATSNVGFNGDLSSGTNKWNLYMGGTAKNYLNGSLLIGSTTDSGEKLQVTGTAKITGASTFGGNLGAANQRVANFRNSGGNGYIELQSSGAGAVALWTASGNEFGIYQNATAGTIGTSVFYINSSGNVGVNTFSINASAKLQVESTTQGFLPPRMTTTQKNAIATPAAGLMVYDTTLNQMSYYNATTWINF